MRTVFKSVFRNFVRKPVINLINLLGLSVSLALVIILSAYCYSEFATDSFHKNGDRVYLYGNYTPATLKEQIDLNVPGVESTIRMASTWESPTFQVKDKEPITSDILYADEDFFKLFTYKAIEGDLETALKEPLSVVITKKLSEKLFGTATATGKTIKLNNNHFLTVKAVIAEQKGNSILSFNAIASIETRKIVRPNGEELTNWGWCNFQTFVLLKDGTNPEEAKNSISSLFPENRRNNYKEVKLIPLKKLYFSQVKLSEVNYLHWGDKKKVMILLMMAALVLLVAVINFINISSSQWFEKIKQIGIMKVIGAGRSTLLLHVLSETFLFFLVAFLLAILLGNITAPFICSYVGIHFNQQLIYTLPFLLVSIGGVFALSMIFSSITAFRISSSKAVNNLKKTVESSSTKSNFRGILVATQFTIAIVLIAFTILVQKQINFGSNLSFNQENILGIKMTPELSEKKEVLKNLIVDQPIVGKISFTEYFPGQPLSHLGRTQQGKNGENKQFDFDTFSADASFLEMMGLKLVAGRFYSDNLSSEVGKIVVNEAFVHEHELADPIGITLPGMNDSPVEIIGVVKDFHFRPVNQPIAPLAIRNDPYSSYCLVRLKAGSFSSLHNAIQDIKAVSSTISPSFPIEISFLDQAVENMYQSELQFRRTFSLFAGCAIVVCCLGILAMSLFACQRRIKEIGIRKINGARVSEVMLMLNKDFVKWVVIAFVIATPIAYFAMCKWLESFAYKTELSWWVFASAGLLALGVALLTVSWQSWKAATRNPVEALRYE